MDPIERNIPLVRVHFRALLAPVTVLLRCAKSWQLVNIFDPSPSEAQAKIRLKQVRQDIRVVDDAHLEKMLTFFDDHWEQALRYLRKKGMGKHRRGSNSASGMRRLRRLEKSHAGIRSAATRQHYIQLYQAVKYLSLDIAQLIEPGPQMTELLRV